MFLHIMMSMSPATATAARPAPRRDHRPIDAIYPAPGLHWVGDGFRVAGYFSSIPDAARRLSPFLLLDYHPPYDYPPTDTPRGVGVHPHRGFETVTLAWQGSVAHHDSAGNGGVIRQGDVQWMTAASGILHKEYHEAAFAKRGGTFHMAQLWVNLPRAHKLDPPRYQALPADSMGIVRLPEGGGIVRVVAGEYRGVLGPAKTCTPINLLDVHLNAEGKIDLAFADGHNTAVLVVQGDVVVGDETKTHAGDLVVFARGGGDIVLEATSDAHVLILDGEPIDEPIVQYGPFVMSSEREIEQAIVDYNRGAFGELDE
jgi:hypothetical protein